MICTEFCNKQAQVEGKRMYARHTEHAVCGRRTNEEHQRLPEAVLDLLEVHDGRTLDVSVEVEQELVVLDSLTS